MHFKKFEFVNQEEINQLKSLLLEYFFEIDGVEFDVDNYIINLEKSLIKYSTLVLLVAFIENKIIGFLFGNTKYYYNDDNCGYILEMFTNKSYRNNHIAKSLIENFENMCFYDKVYLTSSQGAIKFYEKVGYSNSGLVDEDNGLKVFVKIIK